MAMKKTVRNRGRNGRWALKSIVVLTHLDFTVRIRNEMSQSLAECTSRLHSVALGAADRLRIWGGWYQFVDFPITGSRDDNGSEGAFDSNSQLQIMGVFIHLEVIGLTLGWNCIAPYP
jgi:hypothetical protein